MTELLDKYVKNGTLQKNNAWYYMNEKPFARSDKVEAKINEMIKSGELPDLTDTDPDAEIHITDPSTQDERNEPGITGTQLKPFNPALKKNKESQETSIDDIFAPLAANIGDISTRQQGGRFRVYVFGIDSRFKDHPSVSKCPYVFRHNDKKRNVRSGNTIYNEGWTVLSKKLIGIDPRTGKSWLTVARDDTPDEDFFTVGNSILCYADKKQFVTKKTNMDRQNDIRAGVVSDKRQEVAESMAALSKVDPARSMSGFTSMNSSDQTIAKEQLESQGFTSQKANEYIDKMNKFSTSDKLDDDVARLQHELSANNIKSMKVTPLSIDNI